MTKNPTNNNTATLTLQEEFKASEKASCKNKSLDILRLLSCKKKSLNAKQKAVQELIDKVYKSYEDADMDSLEQVSTEVSKLGF